MSAKRASAARPAIPASPSQSTKAAPGAKKAAKTATKKAAGKKAVTEKVAARKAIAKKGTAPKASSTRPGKVAAKVSASRPPRAEQADGGPEDLWGAAEKHYVSVLIRDSTRERLQHGTAFLQNLPGEARGMGELVDLAVNEHLDAKARRYLGGGPYPKAKPRRGPAASVMSQVAFIREAKRRERRESE